MRNQLPVLCTAHGECTIISVRNQTKCVEWKLDANWTNKWDHTVVVVRICGLCENLTYSLCFRKFSTLLMPSDSRDVSILTNWPRLVILMLSKACLALLKAVTHYSDRTMLTCKMWSKYTMWSKIYEYYHLLVMDGWMDRLTDRWTHTVILIYCRGAASGVAGAYFVTG